MALIPSVLQGISEDVPGLGQVPAAAATGQALAKSGGQVAAGSLDLLTEIKQAEAHDTAAKAYYGDIQASTDYMAKLKLNSPDGYMYKQDGSGKRAQNPDGTDRTMTQEYQEWSQNRFQDNYQQLPTAMAQRMYQDRSQEYFNKESAVLKSEQLARQVEAWGTNFDNRARFLRDDLVSSPSVQNTYQYSNDMTKDIMSQVGRLYDKTSAQKQVQKLNSDLAESVMEGARSSVLANIRPKTPGFDRSDAIKTWRNILAGTDFDSQQRKRMGLPTLSDMLAPDKKAEIDRQLIKMNELVKDRDLSDLQSLVSEASAALRNNNGSPDQVQNIRALARKAVDEGKLSQVHYSQIESELMASQVIGQTVNNPSFLLAPQEERDRIMKEAYTKAQGSAQQVLGNQPGTQNVGTISGNTAFNIIDHTNSQVSSASQGDFPAYLGSVDTKGVGAAQTKLDFTNPASFDGKQGIVRSMVTQAKASYDAMYPGQSQYWRGAALTKVQSKLLSDKLKDPTYSTEATTLAIKNLQKAYGQYFPDLMDQMIKDGNLHEGWRYAGIVPQYLSSADVVGALKGRDGALQKNFETLKGEGAKKELDNALSGDNTLKSWIVSMNQQNPNQALQDNQVQAMSEVVKTKAMQLYNQSGGGISLNDAVKQASGALIDRNVKFIDVGRTSLFGMINTPGTPRSKLALPVQMGSFQIGDVEAKKTQDYLNSHLTSDSFKSYRLAPPPQANGQPTKFGDEFYKQVSDTGIYTVANNQRGFNLWYFDRGGNKWVQAVTVDSKNRAQPFFLPIGSVLTSSGSK